jgi:hypothetical protein
LSGEDREVIFASFEDMAKPASGFALFVYGETDGVRTGQSALVARAEAAGRVRLLTGERFFANISRYGLRTVGVGKWKE